MEMIKPGTFGASYTADARRMFFDFHNHQLLEKGVAPDFVFIGDSITEYWDLNLYFGKSGVVVNRGVGGDIAPIVLKRFDADVLQLKPKNIICLIGCNDLMAIHCDHWWKKPGRNPEEVINELETNIEEIIKKCVGQRLYIGSVLPSSMCVPYDAEKFNDCILEINKRIKKLCLEYSVTYLDYHSALCDDDGKTVMGNITYDGIHPTPQGYNLMAEVLKKSVDGIITE